MTRSVLTLPSKLLVIFGMMILGFTSCDKFPPINEGGGKKTIYQTIASDSRFKLLTVAVAKLRTTSGSTLAAAVSISIMDDTMRAQAAEGGRTSSCCSHKVTIAWTCSLMQSPCSFRFPAKLVLALCCRCRCLFFLPDNFLAEGGSWSVWT